MAWPPAGYLPSPLEPGGRCHAFVRDRAASEGVLGEAGSPWDVSDATERDSDVPRGSVAVQLDNGRDRHECEGKRAALADLAVALAGVRTRRRMGLSRAATPLWP